jgi:hypothetical protein
MKMQRTLKKKLRNKGSMGTLMIGMHFKLFLVGRFYNYHKVFK